MAAARVVHSSAAAVEFSLRGPALDGEQAATGLNEREAPLHQTIQGRHRPGGDNLRPRIQVVHHPPGRLASGPVGCRATSPPPTILRAPTKDIDTSKVELLYHLDEERRPPGHRLEQGDRQVGAGKRKRDPGQARAGSDVEHPVILGDQLGDDRAVQ